MNIRKLFDRFPGDTAVYIASVLALFTLTVIVFLLPVSFSVYRSADAFAPVWYVITLSGGVYGAALVISGLMIFLLDHFKKDRMKKKQVIRFCGIVLAVQILISASTLFYFKEIFQYPRPSQLYIVDKNPGLKSREEFFSMPLEEKSKFLRRSAEENQKAFEDIYPPILDSWVSEYGYSFPSGHSETSFFLGTIIAFVIFKTGKKKILFLLPLVWAILVAMSRVIIGVHYPADAAAGAAVGLTIALIILSLKNVRSIFK